MRAKIFLYKFLALLVSTAIFIGIGLVLFEIEGDGFIDEFFISVTLVLFSYSLHYYLVKLLVDIRDIHEVTDAKLIGAFNQICELAGTNHELSKPKLFVLKDKKINAFAWGINIPFLYGLPLIGSCIAVSEGCIEKCNHQELLGIISHEFGHIKAMDSLIGNITKIQGLLGNKIPNILKGGKLTLINIWVVLTWGSLGLLLPLIGRLYSQEAERWADLYSVRLLNSPDPLIASFNSIIAIEGIPDERGNIFAHLKGNHPVIHSRVTNLLELKV